MDETQLGLLERWANRAKRYPLELLSIVGDLASVVGFVTLFYEGATQRLLTLYMISVTTFLGGVAIAQRLYYARKSTYAEALPALHRVAHFVRDNLASVTSLSDHDYRKNVQEVLNTLALAFSVVTGTSCRACVKVLAVHPDAYDLDKLDARERTRHLLVRTLVRDSINTVRAAPDAADFLDRNSDMHDLFVDPTNQRWFFGNDLQRLYARGRYRNSHIPEHWERWPLAYSSALVWPIRRLGLDDEIDLVGFLCVDSRSRRVFVGRFDFDVGALVADVLYMYMKARAGMPARRRREG